MNATVVYFNQPSSDLQLVKILDFLGLIDTNLFLEDFLYMASHVLKGILHQMGPNAILSNFRF